MKLNHIYNILKENQDNLIPERKNVGGAIQDNYQLINLQPMLKSFKAIESLDVFESIDTFKNKYHVLYSWADNTYSSTNGDTINIINSLHNIKLEVDTITNILEKFIPKEEGYIINIKLPEYELLKELPEFYKILDKIFTPIMDHFGDGDDLSIYSFENGSKWNDFLIKKLPAYSALIIFLVNGTNLYKNILEIQKLKNNMQPAYETIQSDVSNSNNSDIFDKIYEQYEDMQYDSYVNTFLEQIEERNITIDSRGKSVQEIKTSLKHSYTSYVSIIKDGTEFYGTVNQITEDIENVNELVKSLESSQKALINLIELQSLGEQKFKSIKESTYEEIGVSIDTDDEDEN